MVAVSTDSWHVHRAWLETSPGLTGIHYPVIADLGQELTRLYGVLDYDDGSAMRATFIIDPSGIAARERHGRQRRPQPGGDAADPEGAAHRRAQPGVVEAGQPTLQVAA